MTRPYRRHMETRMDAAAYETVGDEDEYERRLREGSAPNLLPMHLQLIELQAQEIARCMDARARVSHDLLFGGFTALRLQGVPLPRTLPKYGETVGGDDLCVLATRRNTRTRLRGARYYHMNIPLQIVEPMPGVRCVSVVCAWFMLARFLSLEELVTLGDCLLMRNVVHKRVTIEDFDVFVTRMERLGKLHALGRKRAPRGVKKARRAIALLRANMESPQEARLSLELRKRGLPEPVANLSIMLDDGTVVRGDLVFVEAGVICEYDGAHHLNQLERDRIRRAKIECSGWRYVQVTRVDMATPDARAWMARRVAYALEERTGVRYMTDDVIPLEAIADQALRAPLPGWDCVA